MLACVTAGAGCGRRPEHLHKQGLCGVQGKRDGARGAGVHASWSRVGLYGTSSKSMSTGPALHALLCNLHLHYAPTPLPMPTCPTPQIRVADDAGEWTVSRRYRNFEVLHRQLRAYAAYRLKLPPKRIFIHSNK